MTPAERRARRVAELRHRVRALERELAAARDELRRAEPGAALAAAVRLHLGRGIPAPECAACGRPTRWMRDRWTCPRCGAPVERVEAAR